MPAIRQTTVTLPSDTEVLITREFDAPADLVWRASTEPDLIARWWHAKRGEIVGIDVDLRVGGAWRYAMRTPAGLDVAFRGEYREIVPGERLVYTEMFEPVPHEIALCTATFADIDGRTAYALRIRHSGAEGRDMRLASGMEDGLRDALDLLEQTAASLR
jgi:uncharacterized protein YndB with AHSA1/START domain